MKGVQDKRKYRPTNAKKNGIVTKFLLQNIKLVSLAGLFLLLSLYYNWAAEVPSPSNKWTPLSNPYNTTYPLTAPKALGELVTFSIGLVADLDTNSKSSSKAHTYNSYFKKGYLSYNDVRQFATVTWEDSPATILSSTYSHKGRGVELSELVVYDGRLFTCDDRSGMVFEILNDKIIPWVILIDGNGHVDKGFKCEWATIKDEVLYVGSIGKEWTTATGEFQTYDPMWVKAINVHGEVQHLNWVEEYKALRRSIGIEWPGYMIHESGLWSQHKKKWHFLPRRCSKETYDEVKDELRGCNYLITADEDFKNIETFEITKQDSKMGFSSFRFIPGSNDEAILALKTTEFEGKTETFITAFKTDGTVLLHDTFVENLKYEGLEFI